MLTYENSTFKPGEIIFPTHGCWEVTGNAGTGPLTFVTLVLLPDESMPPTDTEASSGPGFRWIHSEHCVRALHG